MIDLALFRSEPERISRDMRRRGRDADVVDEIVALDTAHRELVKKLNDLQAKRNAASKTKPSESARAELKTLSQEVKKYEEGVKEYQEKIERLLYHVPNLLADDVPDGHDESNNIVVREEGEKRTFDFAPRDYMEIATALNLIDTERAAKVSGARFGYVKGDLALLEFALVSLCFQTLTDEKQLGPLAKKAHVASTPFIPMVPPVMIRPDAYRKMARLDPGQEEERFYIQSDDIFLVGSAEHSIGPYYMDEMVDREKLPIRFIGFSSCFRREAGSYGKDTHGILRVHQFDKLEMECFVEPEDAIHEHNFVLSVQELLMQKLGIPYRVVQICAGDMGTPDARQFDLDAWMPGQNTYRETHTADLMTDYQARRLKTRFKTEQGSTEFVHMVDATAFAIGRTLIALIENYQREDGGVDIPKALQVFMGKRKAIYPQR
ncbi:serine--tRNA ligase [Candidatus Uhrbacteria bacterium]|nr:serine--tRNA ligase [Candidatus Uhrbacteria bacterium]